MARKKMDISPSPKTGNDRLIPVPLKNQPLSPWLRLAHYSNYPAGAASHRANVRILYDFEIVVQVEGSAWIWCDPLNGSFNVNAGDVVLIPPGYPHGWASEPGRHIAVHFDLHARPAMAAMKNIVSSSKVVKRKQIEGVPDLRLRLPGNDAELIIPLITRVRAPALWKERLEPLIQLYSRRVHHSLAAQLIAQETITWAIQTLAHDAPHAQDHSGSESDVRVLDLLHDLERNPNERPSIDELAERAQMGLTAFRSAFHRVTGRSPRAYIEQQRVERTARALVETDRRVVDLARAEGYEDPYHFSRIFKRVMGSSPRHYRRQARG